MTRLSDNKYLFDVFGDRDLSEREWRSLVGLSLQQTEILVERYWLPRPHEVHLPHRKIKHLIWSLNWMKQYSPEDALFGRLTKSKETYRKRVFAALNFLSANLDEVLINLFHPNSLILFCIRLLEIIIILTNNV